jgi:hypothetical protein
MTRFLALSGFALQIRESKKRAQACRAHLKVGDERRAALDACIADAADLLAVEAVPLFVVVALDQRDDVDGLREEKRAGRRGRG